jgi:hypothetical protein
VWPLAMPAFLFTMLRVDRDESPTSMDLLSRTVDWPVVPREGEGVEIVEDLEVQTVEIVGYCVDGHPLIRLGRVLLDDLQVAQLRKAGWRPSQIRGIR